MTEMTKKTIILIVNLGSPQELSVKAIRKFLKSFLSDQRVVGLPRLLWLPILYGVILPFRAKKLEKLYAKIWLHKHNLSPLIYYTKNQALNLQQLIVNSPENSFGEDNLVVEHAFSYAEPTVNDKLHQLHQDHAIENLIILPLYPQFSSTTCASVFDAVTEFYKTRYYIPSVNFINGFSENPYYIEICANCIKQNWKIEDYANISAQYKLVFSFHSLPLNLVMSGDSYHKECIASAQKIAALLNLDESQYMITFQSKFGRNKWIEPATNQSLCDLAKFGVSHIDIICPGFISDCLETLEEIAIQNRELFLSSGGKSYNYIPALNDSSELTNLLYNIIQPYLY